MNAAEAATLLAVELLRKSGVREWTNAEAEAAIAETADRLAAYFFGLDEGNDMATTYQRIKPNTAKVIKSSGGDAAITLASLANGNGTSTGARQAATLDLGASWAQWWRIDTEFELAATPTANAVIGIHGSFYNATGAGVGNTSGSDVGYTGYSNNIDVALNHLEVLGFHVCTSQATSTVQKAIAGLFFPKGRYLNLVVNNKSGAAFHSSDSNCLIRLTPLDGIQEDT